MCGRNDRARCAVQMISIIKKAIIRGYRYGGQKYFPNWKNSAKNLALEKFSNLEKGYYKYRVRENFPSWKSCKYK